MLERPCDAKVSNLCHIIITEEDVLAFEISVHEAMRVDVPESQANLNKEQHDLIFGKVPLLLRTPLDGSRQVPSRGKLHNYEELACNTGLKSESWEAEIKLCHHRRWLTGRGLRKVACVLQSTPSALRVSW